MKIQSEVLLSKKDLPRGPRRGGPNFLPDIFRGAKKAKSYKQPNLDKDQLQIWAPEKSKVLQTATWEL